MRALAVLLLVEALARAAVPTVAVMPFRDLSGGRGAVGEAIRETVTADLKDVGGVRVIERAGIDKVLSEQNLQATRAELDPLSTVKVGKLLGATLIVTGAYQRAASTVRLTARFVSVETGEVVGSAKVDGAQVDLLTLQDRVTVELLRSAKLAPRSVEKFAQRARPKLKSLRAVELYGDAVVEPDDTRRVDLLKLAMNEDPAFEYAARDLDALEKRLAHYDAAASRAQAAKSDELARQAAAESDPAKRALLQNQQFAALMQSRRFRRLLSEARAVSSQPSPSPPPGSFRADELAAFYVVVSEQSLKQYNALLADGEAFLKRFPDSLYFRSVESMVEQGIRHQRAVEEGKPKVAADLAALSSARRWDLCEVAFLYRSRAQHAEAQRLFRACLAVGSRARIETLRSLVLEDLECADWASARKDAATLEQEDPAAYRNLKGSVDAQLPADG